MSNQSSVISDQSARRGARGATRPTDKFFLPYQAKWIKDRARKRIIEKSRQIGISLSTAYDLVTKTSERENQYDAWVSSRDDLQAQLFGHDCANWSRMLKLAAGDLAQEVIDPKEKISAHVLPFKNGRSIYSLSSNPNAQAGKRGRRVFDEFALNLENRLLYAIGQPGTMWGGGMDIISTHRGTANFFNELITEVKHKGNPKGFSLHTVTIQDAVNDGLLGKLKSKWREADPGDDRLGWTDDEFLQSLRNECADEETWLQEFMCQPGDDNAAFLSYDLIAGCEYRPEEVWETELKPINSPLHLGVDVGRDHDLTVFWLIETVNNVRFTRRVICLHRKTFDEQEEVLYGLLKHPRLMRCCIDQTGIGRQFAERAQKRFGEYRVEGIHFTGPVKEELAYPVRAAFEDRSIRIPNDKLVRADLRAIRKETTASGNIRFTADRGKNGHSDRFWGLALALHAAKTAGGPFAYAAVRPKEPRFLGRKMAGGLA